MGDLPVELQERLEREKLESLYQFAYGLSHEINNPLTNISARAQSLLAGEKDPDRRRALGTIHTQAIRAYEMIADLMLFARPPKPRLRQVSLNQLATQAANEWQMAADAQGTIIQLDLAEHPRLVCADPDQIVIAIAAVLRNSLEAVVRGGQITISVVSPSETFASFEIADTGPGIPPDVRRHLFDPYFSGREAGRGLGLGLSKCWRILEQHGGRIEVESPSTGGALFRLLLPLGE